MIKIFTGTTIQNDFNKLANSYGEPIRLKYYTKAATSGTSVYDDDITLSTSGSDVWTSGLIFPINNAKHGSFEAQLLEQGKLQADDMSVYLPGTVQVSGAAVKIGFGSPVSEERFIIWPGAESYNTIGFITGYIKVWTRMLTNGSFIGEA